MPTKKTGTTKASKPRAKVKVVSPENEFDQLVQELNAANWVFNHHSLDKIITRILAAHKLPLLKELFKRAKGRSIAFSDWHPKVARALFTSIDTDDILFMREIVKDEELFRDFILNFQLGAVWIGDAIQTGHFGPVDSARATVKALTTGTEFKVDMGPFLANLIDFSLRPPIDQKKGVTHQDVAQGLREVLGAIPRPLLNKTLDDMDDGQLSTIFKAFERAQVDVPYVFVSLLLRRNSELTLRVQNSITPEQLGKGLIDFIMEGGARRRPGSESMPPWPLPVS